MPTNLLRRLRRKPESDVNKIASFPVPDGYTVMENKPKPTVVELVTEHGLTYQGADLYLNQVPHEITQCGHTFRVVSDFMDPCMPLFFTSDTLPRLLDTIKPDEWSVRMYGDAQDEYPELSMSSVYIADGQLLAIVTAVGGGICTGGVLLHNANIEFSTAFSIDSVNEDLVHILGSALGHFRMHIQVSVDQLEQLAIAARKAVPGGGTFVRLYVCETYNGSTKDHNRALALKFDPAQTNPIETARLYGAPPSDAVITTREKLVRHTMHVMQFGYSDARNIISETMNRCRSRSEQMVSEEFDGT